MIHVHVVQVKNISIAVVNKNSNMKYFDSKSMPASVNHGVIDSSGHFYIRAG